MGLTDKHEHMIKPIGYATKCEKCKAQDKYIDSYTGMQAVQSSHKILIV